MLTLLSLLQALNGCNDQSQLHQGCGSSKVTNIFQQCKQSSSLAWLSIELLILPIALMLPEGRP